MERHFELTEIAREICRESGCDFVSEIGQGGYKETFFIKKNNQPIALKVYKPGLLSERSDREIEAMRRCNHANISKLLSVGTIQVDQNRFFYALEEFLGGGTLQERLQSAGLLTIPTALKLGSYLIDAVGHIQALNLVHRDLKPNNILFRVDTDLPVITDFGIVRDLNKESLTQSWEARGPGTYYYSSPEQLNNDKHMISWRSDQFSLGIVLAIGLFGEHPYGPDIMSVIDNVASYKSPTDGFRTNIKQSKLSALEKMCEIWPANRYRTPEELKADWEVQERSS